MLRGEVGIREDVDAAGALRERRVVFISVLALTFFAGYKCGGT